MYDAFLKNVFADRRMIEALIRSHVPDWASDIDFSTLREETTALVSKKTLQRRRLDMAWSAKTPKGVGVLFLLEFQRTVDRLMALRTTTYGALALEGIAADPDFKAGDALPEFVHLVLYHGDGPWTAQERLADLFERSEPGRYRLVQWQGGDDADAAPDDIAALVLGLARNLSPEEMAEQLSALWRAVEARGDPGMERFVARTVATMLQLRDYPEGLERRGARTMAWEVDRFKQGMEELVQRGRREGRRQGQQQERAHVLGRLAARRFGEETAGRLSEVLGEVSSPDDIDRVTDALFDCATGDEFIRRVRTA